MRKVKGPKTKSSKRIAELIPMAMAALKDQKALTGTWSDYVFVIPETGEPIADYDDTAKVLKYLCKIAGVRFRVQKQTRHSFASNLLEGGESPADVAALLGHATLEMVFRVYAKAIAKGKKVRQQRVSEFANISPEIRPSFVRKSSK